MNMNDYESEVGSFLAGFVIGALVGAATALILAPQSGRATREKIAGISSDIRQAGYEQFDQVRSSAENATREYREKASSIVADTRERAQNLTDQAQDQMRIVLDSGKEAVDEAVNIAEDGTSASA
jgi:gas vesicle protein